MALPKILNQIPKLIDQVMYQNDRIESKLDTLLASQGVDWSEALMPQRSRSRAMDAEPTSGSPSHDKPENQLQNAPDAFSVPWAGYDDMTVSEVIREAKRRNLSGTAVDNLVGYERSTKNRQGVIHAARVNWNS